MGLLWRMFIMLYDSRDSINGNLEFIIRENIDDYE